MRGFSSITHVLRTGGVVPWLFMLSNTGNQARIWSRLAGLFWWRGVCGYVFHRNRDDGGVERFADVCR